ncbi:BMC domain-containing protein [uncultured Veillonella sp.]|uniref:BMC domain-containing protein n=1 Tax=uncultured Veillonella sp. TaxID=159268 RepID=UPI0025857A68|nr:BMC domain-containing protein [uncultured Veillonella sp.]
MKEALGMVEVRGLALAITVADGMAKAANVTLAGIERARGQGWMTIFVTGDVGAVNSAVATGATLAGAGLISQKVIPRPAEGVQSLLITTTPDRYTAAPVAVSKYENIENITVDTMTATDDTSLMTQGYSEETTGQTAEEATPKATKKRRAPRKRTNTTSKK